MRNRNEETGGMKRRVRKGYDRLCEEKLEKLQSGKRMDLNAWKEIEMKKLEE